MVGCTGEPWRRESRASRSPKYLDDRRERGRDCRGEGMDGRGRTACSWESLPSPQDYTLEELVPLSLPFTIKPLLIHDSLWAISREACFLRSSSSDLNRKLLRIFFWRLDAFVEHADGFSQVTHNIVCDTLEIITTPCLPYACRKTKTSFLPESVKPCIFCLRVNVLCARKKFQFLDRWLSFCCSQNEVYTQSTRT